MLNITLAGSPLTIPGNQLQVGDDAPNFTAVKSDLSPWNLCDSKKIKVISVVPSLDTEVCQVQTKKFTAECAVLGNVDLITISLDLPFAQERWCGAESIGTLTLSDYQNRDFATKYALLIDELKLLTRAVLVLDENNTVRYVEYLSEITEEPNYVAALDVVKAI